MNILDSILSAGDGGIVKQRAGQFGITPDQAKSATSALLPALAAGLQHKLSNGGSATLMDTISGFSKYASDPLSLAAPTAIGQGKAFLNQIFGNGDTNTIASMVAEKAGISSSVVTRMLPIGATILGAYLSRSAAGGQGNLSQKLGDLAGAGHGSIVSAVKGLMEKVLG